MPVYIPLNGPGHKTPKAPSNQRWSSASYQGVDPAKHKGWVGLRTDDFVVIDCDSAAAAEKWRQIAPVPTYEVETPHGRHFYYLAVPGGPDAPGADIFRDKGGIDIRAGSGAYVVVPPTPGYTAGRRKPKPFDPRWLPAPKAPSESDESWDTVPEGRRNDTLTALAGGMRRQGMAPELIYQTLIAWNEHIVDPPLERDELELIVRSVARYEAQPDLSVEIEDENAVNEDDLWQWMSGMELPAAPEWYWHPYIPVGRLVLIDGSEGIGKGLLCAHIATDIAKRAGAVLWMAAEDDPEEDIQRRLLAAGYDRKKHAPLGFAKIDPRFPEHVDILERAIYEHDARLVIMDPGRAYLAPPEALKGMSFNDEAYIRPGLQELNRLSKRTGCTVLFVHHWNKTRDAGTSLRAGGSAAFTQVVRHRITLATHGLGEHAEGAFAVTKSNIGPSGFVHGYRVLPNNALDTATFAATDALDEYADLDAWMKAMVEGENDVELDTADEAADAVRALPGGAPVSAQALVAAHGLKRTVAADLIRNLIDEGVLRRSGNRAFRAGENERAGNH